MSKSWWEVIKKHRILNVAIAIFLLSLIFIFRGSREVKENHKEDLPLKVGTRSGDFELSVYLPQSSFPLKAVVPFTLSVTNRGDERATLFFSSGQKFDLAIIDQAGKEIWRWSRGRLFTMAIEELALEKDEEVSLKILWPQADSARTPVSPGTYKAIAESKASEITEKVEIEFVVKSSVERPTEGR